MILQALYELAQAEELIGDPDFEYKPISWVVRLHEHGSLIQIEDYRRNLNEGKASRTGKPLKAKWVGKNELVPVQPTRTSGDCAFFLVDKSEYVFGLDPNGTRPPKKLTLRSGLFREQIEACAEFTNDSSVVAVATFLASVSDDPQAVVLPSDITASDLVAFRVGEASFVHLSPSVKTWWKAQRTGSDGEARYHCLITGDPVVDVQLFPQIKRVPGGTPSGVALVSHNLRAFESYGLAGNDNAPISRRASQAAATALNRLLHREPDKAFGRSNLKVRHVRLANDTVVVYWSPDGDPNVLDAVIGLTDAESADAVADAYRSIWHGKAPVLDDPSRFYAMTLTGTQGRVIVRDWLETTVADLMQQLAQHFADLNVVRNTRPGKGKALTPFIPLRHMMDALSAPGRGAQVPAALAAEFIHAALRGTKYPISILQRALLRQRAEIGGDEWIDSARRDARAALLKGTLIRTFGWKVNSDMNPNLDSTGYNLGILLAVLERLQLAAHGDVNATVTEKFFGAASAMPKAVFPRLLKGARHHARKAQDSDDWRVRAMAFRCERLIDALADGLKIESTRYTQVCAAFPSHLPLDEQSLFVVGYHQMRHWLWMNREERSSWEANHRNVPRAYLWLKEADPVEASVEVPATS